jgi:hypothetical protein
MRQCPSVEGSAPPLITHRISVDVCQARQGAFFHKCHRCIYRGQAASWEPENAPALLDLQMEETVAAAVVKVGVAAPKAGKVRADKVEAKSRRGKGGASAEASA